MLLRKESGARMVTSCTKINFEVSDEDSFSLLVGKDKQITFVMQIMGADAVMTVHAASKGGEAKVRYAWQTRERCLVRR